MDGNERTVINIDTMNSGIRVVNKMGSESEGE